MPETATYAFIYHQLLVVLAGGRVPVRHLGRHAPFRPRPRHRRRDPHRLAVHGLRRHRRCAVGVDLHLHSRARSAACQRLRAGRDRPRARHRDRRLPRRLRDRQPPFHAGAGNRRPGDGRSASSPCTSSPCRAGTSPATSNWNAYGLVLTFVLGLGLERACRQPRQSPGDALVPPWRGDRARLHGLHACTTP